VRRGGGYDVILQLFPTLTNFREKTLLGKVMSIINAPIIFFLAITVPVVEVVEPAEADTAENGGAATADAAGAGAGTVAASSPTPVKVSPELQSPVRAADSPKPAAEPATGAASASGGAGASTPAAAAPPEDDDDVQAVWNRFLFTLQCFLMPTFVVFAVRGTRLLLHIHHIHLPTLA
jgi:hypothetical protein